VLDQAEVDRVLALGPAVTFLCSPNNPTGRVERQEDVTAILDRVPGLLVVDEAYGQFASWSAIDMVDDDLPLVVVRTYSKTWSMAAARLGYLIGPAPLVAALEHVALPYHLDAVKQAAGRLALRFRKEMEARVAMLVEERGRLTAALADLPVETWPSESNFILFRPTAVAGRVVWERLLERSVLVRDCSAWPNLDGCLRVTVGTPEENTAFLAALKEALA
jgi:histidinol-phosphate aminotransferase